MQIEVAEQQTKRIRVFRDLHTIATRGGSFGFLTARPGDVQDIGNTPLQERCWHLQHAVENAARLRRAGVECGQIAEQGAMRLRGRERTRKHLYCTGAWMVTT